MSQMTSRCENTVNTNIKRLTPPDFAKTTLEKGLAAFKQIFSARKPRSLLAPVHSKPPRSDWELAIHQGKHTADIMPSSRQSNLGSEAVKRDGWGGIFLRRPGV